jgi:CHASE3 domain sensor protein
VNKGIILGIIIVIIIVAIIGAASSLNLETNENSSIDNIVEDESITAEETIPESENTGRDISVELSENMGLKSP